MIFNLSSIQEKLANIEGAVHSALGGKVFVIPKTPGRDLSVCDPQQLPPRSGFGQSVGQARLLHDLANIELQAMELAFRTLVEFPNAPKEFREQLADLTLSEGEHLKDCLRSLEALGAKWGDWPVHLGLWQAVSEKDDLLDRILIVHRYLEGAGLDSGEMLLNKLTGAPEKQTRQTVKRIVTEEVDHVAFGSRWFREICRTEKLDPELEFETRFLRLRASLPRRLTKMSFALRERAGFTNREIEVLELWRVEQLSRPAKAVSLDS